MEMNARPLAYEQGERAAREGKELWENPYMAGNEDASNGLCWFAGWCYGKKLMQLTAEDGK